MKKSAAEPWKCLSAIYPYNSLLLKMLPNLKDNGEFRNDGFQPLEGIWNGEFGETNGGGMAVVDDSKKQELKHIVNVCKDNGIQLVMLTSPYYGRFISSKTLEVTDSICEAFGIPYYSYLNQKMFEDPTLFSTGDHLNEKGANIFSSMMAHELKKILKK